jgi:hypothetical protein
MVERGRTNTMTLSLPKISLSKQYLADILTKENDEDLLFVFEDILKDVLSIYSPLPPLKGMVIIP